MNEKETHILQLFLCYVDKTLTEEQNEELQNWLNESSENKLFFSEYLHFYKKSRSLAFAQNIDKEKAWNNILNKVNTPITIIERPQKVASKIRFLKTVQPFLKYAAIFICIIGLTYFYQSNLFNSEFVKTETLTISDDDITLKLDNGKVKVISTDGTEKVVNSKGEVISTQQGNQLDYSKNNTEKLAYNELTVPYGKLMDLVLSDGTKVKLNSGTTIKYPVKFIEGKDRLVYLIGEAYFDVTKDQKHPFIVNANEINVRVLGTQFNLSSYPEDQQINTVLVEGAVSIYNKEEAYNKNTASLLTPGHKAEWEKRKKSISIEEVDTSIYTAWMEDRLIFKDLPFNTIIKKLERHYNVTIVNNNELLGKKYFDATFDIETIEQVLNTLNKNFAIQYTIINNEIIIN